ncbi:hypothetical protein [Streptomyces antibioticus]|uniref:Uncharacterized protein n=1 Tax=Streptomyces antibioticus TaxID=1890 RepID=A0AAE6YF26_STRAT|nr:hypothetical protein [Streptomyces antibioticus]QIT47669.1 hypothetical protein HCX60_32470 [Streptomyces antibioticus]
MAHHTTPPAAGTVSIGPSTADAYRLLPLPETLTGPHLDGHVCVWGGETLTPHTAVDLGSRRIGDRRAFPRACRGCTAKVAMLGLQIHGRDCDDCDGDCAVGRALGRIIRAATR